MKTLDCGARTLPADLWGVKRSFTQGNRVLTKEHLEQVILNPAGFQPFTLKSPKSPFQAGLLLQQIEGYLAQDCQVLGTMVLADPAVIFSKGNIQRPVQAVFDAPMSAGSLQ